MSKLRPELADISRLVIKVGSNVVIKEDGRCDRRKLRILVEDITELMDQGIEVILVSSGSVSLGKTYLKEHMPKEGRVDLQQSASSIGQPVLINIYSRLFEENQGVCSQILLTHDDFRNRKRFLHAKQTIEVLLKNKVVPILNENDSISYSKNTVGDNDHLAAQTAQMVNADALLVITSANGLYDRNPEDPEAKFINTVEFGDGLEHIDMSAKTSFGRGGMDSKIHAINKVTPLGIKAVLSSKERERFVLDPLTKDVGTYFAPKCHYDPELKKAWLLSTKKPNCLIRVDKGAYNALIKGKSLFAKGILEVNGSFYKGDSVDISFNDQVFASGVCEYDSTEIKRIKQRHSDEIEDILGFRTTLEVIQTNNIVINEETENERIS
jgi:glutamate 5-kinase